MKQYIEGLLNIIKNGREKKDRTGTGTISLFGDIQTTDYLDDGFPNLTIKYTWFKGIVHELLWFLNAVDDKYKEFGNTNIKYLVDNNVGIWNEWPHKKYNDYVNNTNGKTFYKNLTLEEFVEKIKTDDVFAKTWGELGPVYGKQWTDWNGVNQIKEAINTLKNNPDDRGIMVSAWNVSDLKDMALRPCHVSFQFYSEELTEEERFDILRKKGIFTNASGMLEEYKIPKRRLSLKMYQRSQDYFLAKNFNASGYALLLSMIAQVTDHHPHKFIHTIGDAHIYSNHKNQVNELLNKISDVSVDIDFFDKKNLNSFDNINFNNGPALPKLWLNPEIINIEDFRIEDIKLIDYKHLGKINAPVAV